MPDAGCRYELVRAIRTLRAISPRAPDLSMEVIPPDEVNAKVGDYLEAGTRMMVVVELEQETATVHTATTTLHLSLDDTLDGADVVPGWTLPLRELFD